MKPSRNAPEPSQPADLEQRLRRVQPCSLGFSAEEVRLAAAATMQPEPRRDDRVRLAMAGSGGLAAGVLLTLLLQSASFQPSPATPSLERNTADATDGDEPQVAAAPASAPPLRPAVQDAGQRMGVPYDMLVAPGRVVSPRSLARQEQSRIGDKPQDAIVIDADNTINMDTLPAAPTREMLQTSVLLNEILGADSL